ncbi:MAG: TetR/AcrR family transcriptional regulator [Victivallaceae bacterium]
MMETKTRRQREKDERRKLILGKAQELFRSNGFSGTTIRQIAKACELAVGTIYLYYKDKNHIYLELINEGYELLINELRKVVESDCSSGKAEKIVDAFFTFAKSHREHFELIFIVIQRERHSLLDLARKDSSQACHKLKFQQEKCLELAMEAIRDSIKDIKVQDMLLTAEAAWSMLAGVVFFFLKDGEIKFEAVSQHAKKIFLNYLQSLNAPGRN